MTFQMISNGGDTEGLFRAGWMESGSALPTGNFSDLQATFDFIASETECSRAMDVLECLRQVSAESITAAMDKTPTFLSFPQVRTPEFGALHGCLTNIQSCNDPWNPHADGVFLRDAPQRLVLEGSVADIPFVVGEPSGISVELWRTLDVV